MSRFKPNDTELTAVQERLVAAMLTSTTVREAARKAKIAERTAWSYIALPHVDAALQQMRGEVRQKALDLLQGEVLRSVETIVTLRDDQTVFPQYRLKAAQVVLEMAAKETSVSESEKTTASGIDAAILPYLSLDQLNELSELQTRQEAILEQARQKKLEQEQGIVSIKRSV